MNDPIAAERGWRQDAECLQSEDRYRAILESITEVSTSSTGTGDSSTSTARPRCSWGAAGATCSARISGRFYPGRRRGPSSNRFRRAMAEDVTVTFEAFYPPHGRWYELHAYPSEDGLSIYFRDMTGRKRAEEETRPGSAASERQRRPRDGPVELSDFNYVFDLEADSRTSTPPSWFGRNEDEAVGRDFFDLGYPPDLAARLHRQIRQVVDTGRAVRDETPFTSHLGERQYEYIFMPVLGAGDVVEAVAGSTRDVTERRRHESESRASRQFLASSIDALTAHIAVLDEGGSS